MPIRTFRGRCDSSCRARDDGRSHNRTESLIPLAPSARRGTANRGSASRAPVHRDLEARTESRGSSTMKYKQGTSTSATAVDHAIMGRLGSY